MPPLNFPSRDEDEFYVPVFRNSSNKDVTHDDRPEEESGQTQRKIRPQLEFAHVADMSQNVIIIKSFFWWYQCFFVVFTLAGVLRSCVITVRFTQHPENQ